MKKTLCHSRPLAVLAALLFLMATACSAEDTVSSGPKRGDASASAAGGGGAGTNAPGGGAGSAVAGNFGGISGSGGGGSAGTGGSDGADADVVDVGVDVPPPIVCPTGIDGTGLGLKSEYFVGEDLTNLKFTRYDASVDFDWSARAPDLSLPREHFSVRWTGQVQPRYTGTYTFSTNTDDGVRLWVDGKAVIDNWTIHGATVDSGTIDLMAGQKYDIKMEYFQGTANALAHLSWSSDCQLSEIIPTSQLYFAAPVCAAPTIATGTGLKGDYFGNGDLTNLKISRTDPNVSFDWGDGVSPDATIPPTNYSVRWTGQVEAKTTESVTFYTDSDDGVRLFVDDALVIDNWTDHGPTEDSGTVNLVAGQKYNVRLEFYNALGGATIHLSWGSGCFPKEPIPTTQLFPTYTGVVCPAPTVGTGTGLQGDYFGNQDLTNLKISRVDPNVFFDWGAGMSPDATIQATNYSVRWTGQVEAKTTEATTFYTLSDDGARLFVNDVPVINDWTDHGATEDSGTVNLVLGQKYNLRLEFYNNGGGATIHLSWGSACLPRESIPTTQLYPTGYTGNDGGSAIDAGTD